MAGGARGGHLPRRLPAILRDTACSALFQLQQLPAWKFQAKRVANTLVGVPIRLKPLREVQANRNADFQSLKKSIDCK
eukprot:COSAG01_NODE_1478_length_10164_cov_66.361550_5_plen_78_part_00